MSVHILRTVSHARFRVYQRQRTVSFLLIDRAAVALTHLFRQQNFNIVSALTLILILV